jgi:hypothetical protein
VFNDTTEPESKRCLSILRGPGGLVRSICRLAWDSCSRPVEVEGKRGARTRVWSTGPAVSLKSVETS